MMRDPGTSRACLPVDPGEQTVAQPLVGWATWLPILIALVILLGTTAASPQPQASGPAPGATPGVAWDKLDPSLAAQLAALAPADQLTVIVTLRDQASAEALARHAVPTASQPESLIRALQVRARTSQADLLALLAHREAQGSASDIRPFWIFNGLAVTASADVIRELAARSDVARISPDRVIEAPTPAAASPAVGPNLKHIGAPALWREGYRGKGVVVASMDTGVDGSHPDLATRWRGGDHSWYDPNGEHATPTDLNGHGTQVMGIMVGGDASGTAIGVAPAARWVAVKIFDDRGKATTVGVHLGFQWLLDPDGDPATPDAPDIVCNAWTYAAPGCDLEFQLDLRALRAAGLLPIFAAGNYGPNDYTDSSPANYPEAFAVGATDISDNLYFYSARGPTACGGPPRVYPHLVAPGVDILSTSRHGLYAFGTGTSMAAPHVAGGLALLLNAYPGLTVAQQESALVSGAHDLGVLGPDYAYGYGRLDILASYLSLASPTPTARPPARVSLPLLVIP